MQCNGSHLANYLQKLECVAVGLMARAASSDVSIALRNTAHDADALLAEVKACSSCFASLQQLRATSAPVSP